MGEIARHAGVSKGTLYVYFQSKEELFERIFEQESRAQAEQIFSLDPDDSDVEGVLRRLGFNYARFICNPAKLSSHRTVIGIAERMPALGQRFFEAGPMTGVNKVRRYLEAQVAAGVLVVPDCELAAAQFLDSCLATLFKPMMFASAPPPTDEQVRHVAETAARVFMAAYGKRD
jgi:AcrR family transcriptional regulator